MPMYSPGTPIANPMYSPGGYRAAPMYNPGGYGFGGRAVALAPRPGGGYRPPYGSHGGFSYSPGGMRAPVNAYNYTPTAGGGYQIHPPGVMAPAHLPQFNHWSSMAAPNPMQQRAAMQNFLHQSLSNAAGGGTMYANAPIGASDQAALNQYLEAVRGGYTGPTPNLRTPGSWDAFNAYLTARPGLNVGAPTGFDRRGAPPTQYQEQAGPLGGASSGGGYGYDPRSYGLSADMYERMYGDPSRATPAPAGSYLNFLTPAVAAGYQAAGYNSPTQMAVAMANQNRANLIQNLGLQTGAPTGFSQHVIGGGDQGSDQASYGAGSLSPTEGPTGFGGLPQTQDAEQTGWRTIPRSGDDNAGG